MCIVPCASSLFVLNQMNLSTENTTNMSAMLAEETTKQFMNQLQTLKVLLIKTQLMLV